VFTSRSRRRDTAAVDADHLAALGVVEHHERVAAEAAHHRQQDAFRRRDRDRRVERVPALLED
jgi:hypothetical protein